MIKGHTKIELTNVKTGEKKVVEDDNLVTDAVKYLINPPFPCAPVSQNSRYPNPNDTFVTNDADKWFGGLLLYNEPIEENVENINIPFQNKMIGNARAYFSPSSNVTEFGSYNFEESTYTYEDKKIKRKFVYDFSTSKANGTIASVALTNILVGLTGSGNYSSMLQNTGKIGSHMADSYPFSYFCNPQYRLSFLNPKILCEHKYNFEGNDSILTFMINAQKNVGYVYDMAHIQYSSTYRDRHFLKRKVLTLYKYYIPITKYNPLLTCLSKTEASYKFNSVYEEINIDVPSELLEFEGKCNVSFYPTNEGVWLFLVDNSSKIKCWFISADLKNNKVVTVTNTTGVSLDSNNYNSNIISMVIQDNYFYCLNRGSNRAFAINLNDNTDVIEFDNTEYKKLATGFDSGFRIIGGQVFRAKSNSSSGVPLVYGVLNIKDRKIIPLNYNFYERTDSETYGNDTGYFIMPVCNSKTLVFCRDQNSNQASIGMNPFLLSTINNLPEPVTKTADMTMKITYTLTSDLE